ncbi:cupin domain-containing protein [Cnuibacter physcomitrellae]|uniref:cupin domain-containing protein n=1 Tax=Cnuibacter physcomitrellae TaxID=1619308 RepID=UPI00217572F7|nr:cupin domain-containing protein [Cnuibacter physcomitrellae]MCS5499415.1 cupin domain-containing protein [Cnuibacter physcomitrellae]
MSTDVERGPSDRPALSRCIGVSPDTFAREYWGASPLLTPASALPRDFDDLFSSTAVDELVSRRGVRTPFIRMAQEGDVLSPGRFTGSGGFGAEIADQVDSAKVLARFADGATIVLQGLHRLWPPLIDFTRELVDDLGHPAQVNAYVTPASSRGFDPHYDVHDVFVLQIAGEKHWRIHAPVHEHPLRDQPWSQHRAAVAARAEQSPVIDAVLRPGDALYLPRGWIHSAEALGGTSVHLTIGMPSFTRDDVLRSVLAQLGESPELRRPLPLGVDWTDAAAVRPLVEETLEALRTALPDADELPDDVVRPVADALAAQLAETTRPEPVSPLATVDAIALLDGRTRVRWRAGLRARLEESDGRISIRSREGSLSLPAEAADALHRLAAGGPIAVADLPGLDPESAVVVARRLLREAVLVLAP